MGTTMLGRLKEFKDEINSTTSRTNKISIASKYEDIIPILNLIYDEDVTFGIKSSQLSKYREGLDGQEYDSLIDLLNALSSRETTGNHAITSIMLFKSKHEEHSDLIDNIIDKDLRCRFGKKDYLKAFPGVLGEWEIALGEKYSSYADKITLSSDYFVSRKLDGVRVVAIKNGNSIEFRTRSGKHISTLDNYIPEIVSAIKIDNCVLDGELIMEKDDSDDFKSVMKQLNKKNHQIDNLTYVIFDCLTIEEFDKRTSKRNLSERHIDLLTHYVSNDKIKILEQFPYSTELFDELSNKCRQLGWEGLILRKNTIYKGKRSADILKWKEFFDDEYVVTSIESGIKQMVVDGHNIDVECMARVNIVHKGNIVGVGSGWSDTQRVEFHRNPSLIIGKVITVSYKQETVDENGEISLQFPTVVCIHGSERIF